MPTSTMVGDEENFEDFRSSKMFIIFFFFFFLVTRKEHVTNQKMYFFILIQIEGVLTQIEGNYCGH